LTYADGYREIRTSALTLRYRLGSGPFTATNVSVALTGTTTTANPSFPSYCVASAVCEAENALPLGHAGTALDHRQIYDCNNTPAQQFRLH
jgi:hypothetical protein